MFPTIRHPLHIFEPRYISMIQSVLDSRGCLSMATLSGDWQDDYEGNPTIHPMGCICHVTNYKLLPSGHYNIMLEGLHKVRLDEVPSESPYRLAAITVQDMEASPGVDPESISRMRDVICRFFACREDSKQNTPQYETFSTDMLLNFAGFYMSMDVEQKMRLLAQSSYTDMCQALLKIHEEES